jgi:hypothetical protein
MNRWARDRQVGKFYLSTELVETGEAAEMLIAMGFTPLRVEYLAHADCFEYIGISHLFRKISPAVIVPVYDLTASADYNSEGEIIGPIGIEVTEQ